MRAVASDRAGGRTRQASSKNEDCGASAPPPPCSPFQHVPCSPPKHSQSLQAPRERVRRRPLEAWAQMPGYTDTGPTLTTTYHARCLKKAGSTGAMTTGYVSWRGASEASVVVSDTQTMSSGGRGR
ncbi:hypothetical protein BOTBODRAFT_363632 [Botryobasidium botryosum FD-172 SS1]|uniref:Uncharacterized protein n=1 Tax=Botryobasidium botryosum (strain FD-172 SS1) TaxID=930990 RepID=A0A067MPV3_BOTB1|nr:hypothetical protein BOTBODRAFT_363632 [Botryobasidium botryosum FD-172 SS1]